MTSHSRGLTLCRSCRLREDRLQYISLSKISVYQSGWSYQWRKNSGGSSEAGLSQLVRVAVVKKRSQHNACLFLASVRGCRNQLT